MNLADPVRNLAVFLSANPTFGIWSPNWTVGGQKFWNTMEFDDPRSATGKVKETYTMPIFFIDLNNAFRLPHRWQLEANMNIMTKGDVINFRMQSASYNLGFVVQKCWLWRLSVYRERCAQQPSFERYAALHLQRLEEQV